MNISLIAAIGKKNEIGKDNQLLWKLPADLKHFKETTSGYPVVMGRKTFESLGRPLPNRRNIVITRDESYTRDGIEVVHSLDEALELFQNTEIEVFVIGGGQIYTESMHHADKLYITHVDAELPADTYFPTIGPEWEKISEQHHEKDTENDYAFSIAIYKKMPTK